MSRFSALSGSTFTGDKQRNFKELLSVLDHVNPIFVSREEFNSKDGEFLLANGSADSLGIFYDLYIPRDLMKGEQLELTLLLTEKFGLTEKSQEKVDELLGKIKILVAGLLRKNGGKEFIQEVITKYGISPATISRIETTPIKLGNRLKDAERRDLIRIIQNRLEENGGITPLERKAVALEFGGEYFLENELERVFLRKGLDMLRQGAMTMSNSEVSRITEELKSKDYKLENSDTERDYWKGPTGDDGDDYVWTVIRNNIDYDNEAILLREKMRINEWKKKINEARESGNQELIEEIELEASQFVLKMLQESYIYQTHSQVEGHNLVNIASKKELQCFGFTILGHVFLSELRITHSVVTGIPQHVTLAVKIVNNSYLFEGTSTKSLIPLKINSTEGASGYDIEFRDDRYRVTFGDPEKIILDGIKHHIDLSKEGY